jgi:hypothetical protein
MTNEKYEEVMSMLAERDVERKQIYPGSRGLFLLFSLRRGEEK